MLLAIQLRHVFVRAHDEVFDEPEMKRILVHDKEIFSRIYVEILQIRTVFSHHVKQAKLTFVCVVHGFIIIEKILGKNESKFLSSTLNSIYVENATTNENLALSKYPSEIWEIVEGLIVVNYVGSLTQNQK